MSNIRQIVGQNIRLFRQTQGLTQELLAERLDISDSYIGYLERGAKSPSLELLAKIADVLQVEPEVLLTSPKGEKNQELKKLLGLLSGKKAEAIIFINEVAIAYFKSLDKKQQ